MSNKNKLKAELILEVAQLQERVNELESGNGESIWHDLVESLPDHITILDTDLNIQYVNRPSPGLSSEELVGFPIIKFVVKEKQKEIKAILKGVLKTGQPAFYETEYPAPDGEMIYYETHAIPRTSARNVVGLTLSSRDISNRKQVEMELQKERFFTQNIVNTARVIILLLDVEGKIISINPYMEHISGYSLDEVIGKDWFTTYLPVKDRKYIRKLFNTALKDSSTEGNINPIVTKDGREKLIEWYDSTFQDEAGNSIGLLAVGQDITERVQAKKEQQASEDLLNDTQELTKAGGWKWNVENKSMFWTDETYRIHEIDRTAIEPGSLKYIEDSIRCYDEKDRLIILEAFQKCAEEGLSYDLELPFTTVKGNRKWVRTTARAEKENDKVVDVIGNIMDITERVQSEKALTRKNKVFDASLAAQSILNLEGFLSEVNQSFLEIWGFSNQEEVIGKSILEFLQHEHEAEAILEALQKTGSWSGEYTAKRGDGSTFIARGLATVIQDLDDEIIGYQSSATDITERKRREEEIQSLAKFLSENPHPVLRISQDGTLLYANSAAFKLLEETPVELGQAAPPKVLEAVFRSMKTGKLEEMDLSHDKIIYLFFIVPVVQSGYANLYGIDITERKQAEKMLLENEEKFYNLFNNSEVGMFRTRLNGTEILDMNTKFLEIFGYTRTEMQGSASVIHWADPREREEMVSQLQAKGRVRDFEAGFLTKNGKVIKCLTSLVLYPDKGILEGSIIDITERLQMEEEKDLLLKQLQLVNEDVRALSRDLINSQEDERKRIAQELHDEFGQGLTAISLDLEIIERGLDPEIDQELKNRLNGTKAITKELDERVSELALDLRPSLLDDLGLLPTINWYVDRFSRRSGVEIDINVIGLETRLPREIETALYRIIQEALTNVTKHAQASKVKLRLKQRSKLMTVTIKDNGIGFDHKEIQNNLLHQTLGLVGMRERISNLGGRLEIHSKPGEGTRIEIEIPL